MKKAVFLPLILIFCSLCFANQRVPVPSQWRLFQSESIQTPQGLPEDNSSDWKPVTVPEYTGLWTGQKTLWYKCELTIPQPESPDKRVFLRFESVKFSAVVWLDGKEIGSYYGGGEPFEFDITPFLTGQEKYEALVRVQGYESISKPAAVEEKTPDWGGMRDTIKDRILWPIGSQGFNKVGIWEPVVIEIRDSIQFDDVFIQTSVRNKSLKIDAVVKNLTDREITARVNGTIQNWSKTNEQGQEEKENQSAAALPRLAPQTIVIPPRGTKSFSWRQPWEDPVFWSPRRPHLYNLNCAVTLCGENTPERILPVQTFRFGFREFWTQGDLFYLNGTPMHALGTSKHPDSSIEKDLNTSKAIEMYRSVRRANCNFMRLHANLWPANWVDAADESGMPLILESAAFCYARCYALTDPQFWTNYQIHIKALQKRFLNNPSFCILSMENEILHCGGNDCDSQCETNLVKAGIDAKAFDSTRPIMYEADGDVSLNKDFQAGQENPQNAPADIVNIHYPLDFVGKNKGFEDSLWPDCAWWIEQGKVLASYPHTFWKWDRKKPLYIGEFLHLQGYQTPDSYSQILQKEAYNISQDAAMAQTKALTWSMQIPAYRASGVTGLCPWVITEPGVAPIVKGIANPRYAAVQSAYKPVTLIAKPVNGRVWKGTKENLELYVINDTDAARDIRLTLRFSQSPVKMADVPFSFRLNPAEIRKINHEIAFPQGGNYKIDYTLAHSAAEDGAIDWNYRGALLPDGQDAYFVKSGQEESMLCIFAALDLAHFVQQDEKRSAASGKEKSLGLYGVESQTVRKIAAYWGSRTDENDNQPPQYRVFDLKSLDDFNKAELVIIGRNKLKELFPPQTELSVADETKPFEKFKRFLFNGGRILVLEQDEYPAGLFPVEQSHLSLNLNLKSNQNLYMKSYLCKHPFITPSSGGWSYSKRIAGPDGLNYTPQLSCRVGKGALCLCQYPLESLSDESPAYVSAFFDDPQFNNRRCAVHVADSTGLIQKTFDKIGVKYTQNAPEREDVQKNQPVVVFVNANTNTIPKRIDNVSYRIYGISPDNINRWVDFLPGQFSLTENTIGDSLGSFDTIWYAPRKGLHYSTLTPRQKAADWLIVPFQADDSPQSQLLPIDFTRFDYQNDKVEKKQDCLYAFTGVDYCIAPNVKSPGWYYLELDAHGSYALGEGSRIRVSSSDSAYSSSVELDNQYSKKRVPIFVKPNSKITLSFYNDKWDPATNQDRNFWIRSVRFIPVTYYRQTTELSQQALSQHSDAKAEQIGRPKAELEVNNQIYICNIKWFNPDCPTDKPQKYLQRELARLGADFESPFSGLILPGAAGELNTKQGKLDSSPNGAAHLGTNGTLKYNLRFGRTGAYKFTLFADGSAVEGVYPHLNLKIDGQYKGEFQLKSDGENVLSVRFPVDAGMRSVELQFDNDAYIPPAPGVKEQDRNVNIRKLKIEP